MQCVPTSRLEQLSVLLSPLTEHQDGWRSNYFANDLRPGIEWNYLEIEGLAGAVSALRESLPEAPTYLLTVESER